ncbi:MAG: hypothetical protein ACRET5_20580 [Steroidobacteraceae bacterium]
MRTAHRIGVAAMTAALAMGWAVCGAADPPQQSADPRVDVGLLEFLGSGDPSTDSTQPDDGSWLSFLAQVDIGKAAKASQVLAPPKPASAPVNADKPSG